MFQIAISLSRLYVQARRFQWHILYWTVVKVPFDYALAADVPVYVVSPSRRAQHCCAEKRYAKFGDSLKGRGGMNVLRLNLKLNLKFNLKFNLKLIDLFLFLVSVLSTVDTRSAWIEMRSVWSRWNYCCCLLLLFIVVVFCLLLLSVFGSTPTGACLLHETCPQGVLTFFLGVSHHRSPFPLSFFFPFSFSFCFYRLPPPPSCA